MDAGSQPPLVHGHGEADGSTPSRFIGRCLERHVEHVAGNGLVESQFLRVEVELGRASVAIREQLPHDPRLGVRKGDHCLLGPSKVRGSVLATHGLFETPDVRVGIAVQEP